MTVSVNSDAALSKSVSTVAGRTGSVTVDTSDLASYVSANQLSVYAAGTAYTITNTSAAIMLGTTSPSLTLNAAGTYLLQARVRIENVGATFAASRVLTSKLRRTNNTAADLTNGSIVFNTPIITALTSTLTTLNWSTLYTTAVATDIISLFADLNTVASVGSSTVVEASIVAIRLPQ